MSDGPRRTAAFPRSETLPVCNPKLGTAFQWSFLESQGVFRIKIRSATARCPYLVGTSALKRSNCD